MSTGAEHRERRPPRGYCYRGKNHWKPCLAAHYAFIGLPGALKDKVISLDHSFLCLACSFMSLRISSILSRT